MSAQRSPISTPRVVLGLLLAAFGLVATLENLGYEVESIGQYWPVLVILIGLLRLVTGSPSRASGLFWLLAGSILLLPAVSDRVAWQDIWPLLLILGGLALVGRSFLGRRPKIRRGDSADWVSGVGMLHGFERRLETDSFRGGDLLAFMGACEVDLTRCDLAPEGAEIQVLAFWGGIELRVPEDWVVEVRVSAFMGGAEEKVRQRTTVGPPLVVRGLVMMGGIEVRN